MMLPSAVDAERQGGGAAGAEPVLEERDLVDHEPGLGGQHEDEADEDRPERQRVHRLGAGPGPALHGVVERRPARHGRAPVAGRRAPGPSRPGRDDQHEAAITGSGTATTRSPITGVASSRPPASMSAVPIGARSTPPTRDAGGAMLIALARLATNQRAMIELTPHRGRQPERRRRAPRRRRRAARPLDEADERHADADQQQAADA